MVRGTHLSQRGPEQEQHKVGRVGAGAEVAAQALRVLDAHRACVLLGHVPVRVAYHHTAARDAHALRGVVHNVAVPAGWAGGGGGVVPVQAP